MKNILSQISQLAEKENISIGALERKIGASKGVLSRAIANNTDIQSKWIQLIVENYPHVNIEWLITGMGEMYKSENNVVEVKSVDNEYLLRRFEELIVENALLKKENEELSITRGKSSDAIDYVPNATRIGSYIAAEPKK